MFSWKNVKSNYGDGVKKEDDGKTMNLYPTENDDKKIDLSVETEVKPAIVEDWQWIDGYKCTDLDMKCKNEFQFELNKQYDIDNNKPIVMCSNGFHFCKELKHLFVYNNFTESRFFKCKSLVDVNSIEYKTYGSYVPNHSYYIPTYFGSGYSSYNLKCVAKSIVLTEEIDIKDTFKDYCEYNKLYSSLSSTNDNITDIDLYLDTYKYKDLSLAIKIRFVEFMKNLGYSEAFASLFTMSKKSTYDDCVKFISVLSAEGLSKDMTVYLIIEKFKEFK